MSDSKFGKNDNGSREETFDSRVELQYLELLLEQAPEALVDRVTDLLEAGHSLERLEEIMKNARRIVGLRDDGMKDYRSQNP